MLHLSQHHTLCTVLANTAERCGDHLAYSDRLGPRGELRTLTWRQFRVATRRAAAGLIARGVSAGDRVAIMASNRIEHIVADAAALHAGAIPVPIYLTAAAEQIAAIAAQCTPTVLVVETADQLERWAPAVARLDQLKLIVSLDDSVPVADAHSWQMLIDAGANCLGDRPRHCELRWQAVSPDAPATVVFTSGTTGAPKGVVLNHRNVVYEANALLAVNGLTDAGTSVSYLPFAHIAERMLSMYLPYVAGGHVRLLANAAELAETLHELRPTRFFGVPRIWEKIQTWVSAGRGAADEFNTAEVRAALDTGRRYVTSRQSGSVTPAGLLEEFESADAQILSGLRSHAGLDRLVWATTAAAPMPEHTLKFFAGLGIRIYDAYGMTETCGTATTNTETAYRLGSVGLPLPGVPRRHRRRRRDLAPRADSVTGVLPAVRGRRRVAGEHTMAAHRRSGPSRRRWVPLHRGPQEGNDHHVLRQKHRARRAGTTVAGVRIHQQRNRLRRPPALSGRADHH